MPQITDFLSFPSAVVWDDMLALTPAPTQSGGTTPTSIDFGVGSAIRALAFSIGDGINGMVQFSHSYKEGSSVEPHIHWAPITTSTDNVKWQLDYYWLNINQAASGAPASDTCEQAGSGAAWNSQYVGFLPFITGTGKNISSIFMFKLTRIAATAPEMVGRVALLAFDIHYAKDAIGSRQDNAK